MSDDTKELIGGIVNLIVAIAVGLAAVQGGTYGLTFAVIIVVMNIRSATRNLEKIATTNSSISTSTDDEELKRIRLALERINEQLQKPARI